MRGFRVWLFCNIKLKIIIIFRKNRKHKINLPTTQVTGIKTAWRGIFQLCCSKYITLTDFQHRVNCKLCKDVTSCIKNIRRKNLILQLFWFQMIFGCEPKWNLMHSKVKFWLLSQKVQEMKRNQIASWYSYFSIGICKLFLWFDICQNFDLILFKGGVSKMWTWQTRQKFHY